MGKYSDIDRARELLVAKTALDNWRDMGQAGKVAAYEATKSKTGNRKLATGTVEGYIRPFGYLANSKIFLKVDLTATYEGTPPANLQENNTLVTKLITEIYVGSTGATKYGTTTKPGTGSHITGYQGKGDKSKLARITLRQKGTPLAEKIASRVTGVLYRYTPWDAVSCAFGQDLSLTTGTQSFSAACGDLDVLLKDLKAGFSTSYRSQGVITVEVVA